MSLYLETERLILRDFIEADIDDYYKLKTDPESMYYVKDISVSSYCEARDDLAAVLDDAKSEERKLYFFRVEIKTTHELIGSVGYNVEAFTPAGKHVHLGYFTYKKYWNNGYVTEAVRRILEFAFEENDVFRVTTGCLAENKGSERVMQKCGMIKEAEYPDWEWHDDRLKARLGYRLLRSEWLTKKYSNSTVVFPSAVDDSELKFAVIAARYMGKWIFCRHKKRTTWETPGGHREAGESIEQAARRELWEETGATEYKLSPVCIYGVSLNGETTYGKLFLADVSVLGELPELEIGEIALFDALPSKMTYTATQTRLFERVKNS